MVTCVCLLRMRDAARKMAEKHFSDRTTEHVEFLPVEWRSKLSLDGGVGEDQIQFKLNSFVSVYGFFLEE